MTLAQLKAEAARYDRVAELHGENLTDWLIARDQHKANGNHETAAEFALMALRAEELVERNLDRAAECRRQAARFGGLANLVFDVTARTVLAA